MCKRNWFGIAILSAMGISGAMMLQSCASALDAITAPPPPTPSPIVATVTGCPTIHEFTPKQNADLAAALRALPSGSIWHDVAEDDQKMRAQARACIAFNKAK